VRVSNRVPTTNHSAAATTRLGRTDNINGNGRSNATGKSGKGRAAKRQRQERAAAGVQEAERAGVQEAKQAGVKQAAEERRETVSSSLEAMAGWGKDERMRPPSSACSAASTQRVRPPSPAQSVASTASSSRNSGGRSTERWAASRAASRAERTPLAELRAGEKREKATVTGVQAFGAFVDVGAEKDGLLPTAQLALLGGAVAVGQAIGAVFVRQVDLTRGRVTLSPSDPKAASSVRSRCDSRASNTSSVGESVASRSSLRSSVASHASSRVAKAAVKGAAIEALAAALAVAPDTFFIDGTVANVTDFGAFVRLDGRTVADIMQACHADGRIDLTAPPAAAAVDGLLHRSELAAAYRAGIIGAAGDVDGVKVGSSLRVRVVEVDAARQQVRLSLLAIRTTSPAALDKEVCDLTRDPTALSLVDEETLAGRLLWQPPPEKAVEVVPLAACTLRRFPKGAFRTIKLFDLPWKAEGAKRLPQHPASAAA